MKQNNVIYWVLLTLFVASCSKAPEISPTEESTEGKALLSFTVDGFAQENLPFPKSPNLQSSIKPLSADAGGSSEFNLRDHANVIRYILYKQTTRIDSLTQYASDPNFGTYSKLLPLSADSSQYERYQVHVLAAMMEDGHSMTTSGLSTGTTFSFSPNTVDAFYHFSEAYLFEGDQIKSAKIRRFVGKVEVLPTDTIPANAARVEIEVSDIARYFQTGKHNAYFSSINKDGTGGEVKSVSILPEDIGTAGKTFSSYFMFKNKIGTTVAPRTVTITTYDKDDNVIIKRVVPNVNLQVNQITRLRGPIFSNRSNADFSVELESDWKTEIPEVEF